MRYGIKFLFSIIFIVLLLNLPAAATDTDAATIPDYQPPLNSKKADISRDRSDELISDISEIALVLCRNMEYPSPFTGDIAEGLLITAFVKLDDLYSTSSFGRYLAEQLITEFQQRRYNVMDIRKSRSILIRKQRGEFGISREPSAIKSTVSADGLLTGTYLVNADSILVNARILDNKTGKVLAGATKRISRTPVIDEMLSRGSPVNIDRKGVMYMKELGVEP